MLARTPVVPNTPPVIPSASSSSPRRVDTRSLMAGGNLLVIEHDGMQYTLRITRTGKLILTK